jgi:hypothetical protein
MSLDRRAYMKAYYVSHKEQLKAQQKAYYDSHPEKVKLWSKRREERLRMRTTRRRRTPSS